MQDQLDQSHEDTTGHRRRQIFSWLIILGVFTSLIADTYRRHAEGESWASAFGFPVDLRFLAGFVGGFVVPLVLTMAMLRYAKRLAPSREKTILTRIGWSLYGYLFFWSVIFTLYIQRY